MWVHEEVTSIANVTVEGVSSFEVDRFVNIFELGKGSRQYGATQILYI